MATTKKETPAIAKDRRYYYSLGRRKTASARVRLYKKGLGKLLLMISQSPIILVIANRYSTS